jgi:hypothetical protein
LKLDTNLASPVEPRKIMENLDRVGKMSEIPVNDNKKSSSYLTHTQKTAAPLKGKTV